MSRPLLKLFDVTLRDGLQSSKINHTLKTKRKILHNIISRKVNDIEVGSFVSPKILPQMANSIDLFKYSQELGLNFINFYMLTPNSKYVSKALDVGVNNFSLITSVSNKFQEKNINKTLDETKEDLKESFNILDNNKESVNNIKLYVSCIQECPIEGKLSLDYIVRELLDYYYNYPTINNLCISDTCGTLNKDSLEFIINSLILDGVNPEKLSLHLHCNEKNMNNVYQIIKICTQNNINLFDVSLLETGGCSVTMDESKINRNLSYNDVLL